MKYQSITIQDKVDLIVREELNKQSLNNSFESFIKNFIEKTARRLTALVQDEIKYRRY